jgi:type VI secretion system protein ImpJ
MGMDGKIPAPIHWHEGLLLTPQHFQQLSLRQEALLQYNASMIAPFHWGIRYLKIEKADLVKGVVKIKHLEAVMPDGLVVYHRENDDNLEGVDLNDIDGAKLKPMKVYLAVARQTNETSKGENARYNSVEGEPVADEYTGEGKLRILRLVPRLKLKVSETPPKEFDVIPLMEVKYENDGFVQTEFIPPLLIVTSQPPYDAQSKLGIDCGRIADLVRDKAQELAGLAGTQSAGMRLDLETKSWIRSLTASLPYLETILNTEVSHPYQVYLALCSMAGHLAALGPKIVPDKGYYDHHDLHATFQPVIEFIEQALKEGLTSTFQSYKFIYQDGIYWQKFEAGWERRRLVLSLRAQPGVSEEDLVKWGKECLIGSEKYLQSMRAKRILGASRRHIERDGDLVPSKGVVLFSLTPDEEFIEPGEVLQIFNSSERGRTLRPAEIVLHVKNPTEVKRGSGIPGKA